MARYGLTVHIGRCLPRGSLANGKLQTGLLASVRFPHGRIDFSLRFPKAGSGQMQGADQFHTSTQTPKAVAPKFDRIEV